MSHATVSAAPPLQITQPQAAQNRQQVIWRDRLVFGLLQGVAYSIVLFVVFLVGSIVAQGLPVLTPSFLLDFPTNSGATGGIFPVIIGTLALVAMAIGIALPLGVLSAIYLSEYAQDGPWTDSIRLAMTTLAGVPSIVFGLFGLSVFVLWFDFGASILSGGLTLACMILPTLIVASEQALKAVPKGYRDASLALGATHWQTIQTHVLPYSLPGILTGAILAIGRAAGETAPILLTVAAFYLPFLPQSVFDQVMALPYHLYVLATQHPDIALVRPMQYGTALVLLLVVLGFSSIAIVLRQQLQKRF